MPLVKQFVKAAWEEYNFISQNVKAQIRDPASCLESNKCQSMAEITCYDFKKKKKVVVRIAVLQDFCRTKMLTNYLVR